MCKKIFFALLSILLVTGSGLAEEAYNLQLKTGDNLIALPLLPQDTNIASILSPIITQVKDVWEFNPLDANDPWKHYQPGMEEYSDLQQMAAGRGYWINVKKNLTLQITGTPLPENHLLSLKAGWNTLGWPYRYSQEITAALCALNFATDYNQASRFNSAAKTQENYLNQPASDNFTAFEAGRGYYIYMLKDKTIRIGLSVPIDITPPTGTITINNGSQYANSTSVTLNLSAIDSGSGMGTGAQMQFSNDNTVWSTPENYSTTKSWALASGEGEKRVYVKFKDAAGNWSQAYSNTLILDTQGPSLEIISPQEGQVIRE